MIYPTVHEFLDALKAIPPEHRTKLKGYGNPLARTFGWQDATRTWEIGVNTWRAHYMPKQDIPGLDPVTEAEAQSRWRSDVRKILAPHRGSDEVPVLSHLDIAQAEHLEMPTAWEKLLADDS